MMNLKTITAGFGLVLIVGCGGSSDNDVAPPPAVTKYTYQVPANINDGWDVRHAQDLGVNVGALEKMVDKARQGEFSHIDAIAVSYQGQLIFDETIRTRLDRFDEMVGNQDLDLHAMFSTSKTIASIAAGVAIDQGYIADVDTPYLALFNYVNYQNWDPQKSQISLEDALTMRFGLDWNEWDPPYSSNDNQMHQLYNNEYDISKAFLDLPIVHEPGTRFAYSTPGSASIGQALEHTTGMTLEQFGSQYLLGPLTISQIEARQTPSGLMDLGRGLFLTARDLLKFGQLYLNDGQWQGQQLISKAWVNASTQSYFDLSWLSPEKFDWQVSGYGYLWWLGYFEIEQTEYLSYAGRGFGGQTLMVIPELELVIVVFASDWDSLESETNAPFKVMREAILPAILN
ncbi:MAG: serine hydrolase [Gammaproteobacteria bacterium]|nr:serine hydrolase [Gammaproteobacteria bacterium]